MLSSSHREREEHDSVPWRMKNWWQNSIYIWLRGWTGWLCTTGQKAEPGETLIWRRHSFAEVWYACSRTPQAGSESISGLHTVSQGTIKLLARSSLPKQQLSAFAQHRQALCRRNLWGASDLECAHEQPGAAWVHSHSSQIKMRLSAATLQISIMHWVGLVLCRSVWPALQVLRATQQILGSPTRFGPSESEHRFDLWMRCRNAAPSAC